MEARSQIQQTNDDLYAAWNSHDADAVGAVYAEDAEFVDVVSGVTTRGRDAIRTLAVNCFTGFPDVVVAPQMRLIDGGAGADRWVMSGTQTGEYDGLPPTRNPIEVAGATFSEYDERGLVVRATNYLDIPAFLRQLGLG